jgi:signal transduction histidine kinase
LAALGVALGAAALLAAPAPLPGHWQYLLVLVLGFAMLMLICLQAVVWQGQLLRLLELGGRELAQSLAQRRRLLGTLFHDLANPLTALLGLCEQARAGMASEADPARARRLAQRLHELLEGSQAWLMGDGADDGSLLQTVALEPVLAGMADLYQESLAAKRLGLSLSAEAGLQARAQGAVLRDSVLSNLVSNAIKFSRPGSLLELDAMALDGQVCIELRDRGPGLEAGLREALEAGHDLPSQAGTHGETGSGLGLALAREHIQRMGGRLELLDREGGGTLTRVWLKAA